MVGRVVRVELVAFVCHREIRESVRRRSAQSMRFHAAVHPMLEVLRVLEMLALVATERQATETGSS